ncbi:MAG: hypothetical protein IIX49_03460 [Oscillospiraceae bacterium]|nr:hypothetical protein [Oscillospiraceae bacterium]
MGDHPGKNLKWLEQELLAEDTIHRDFSRLPNPEYQKDEDLLELVDILIGEDAAEPEPPVRNFANHYGGTAKSVRAEQAHIRQQFDPSAAVLTKTGKQLRSEKIAEKKANVNRNLKDLVFLAILECIGILAILGWWLQ